MFEQLNLIEFEQIEKSDEAEKLAVGYIGRGAFREKSINDSRHVAYAVLFCCDVVLSLEGAGWPKEAKRRFASADASTLEFSPYKAMDKGYS